MQYRHSRGLVRDALSQLMNASPLRIPLTAPPGEAPKLPKKWGHISFSHCKDMLLIGWSIKKLGVDIESKSRSIDTKLVTNRFFNEKEKEKLKLLPPHKHKEAALKSWVTKEAAIKWQNGRLMQDIALWSYYPLYKVAHHNELNYTVRIHQIEYKNWYIGVAYDQNLNINNPIICA